MTRVRLLLALAFNVLAGAILWLIAGAVIALRWSSERLTGACVVVTQWGLR